MIKASVTTAHLSYRVSYFETSATALCGTTGITCYISCILYTVYCFFIHVHVYCVFTYISFIYLLQMTSYMYVYTYHLLFTFTKNQLHRYMDCHGHHGLCGLNVRIRHGLCSTFASRMTCSSMVDGSEILTPLDIQNSPKYLVRIGVWNPPKSHLIKEM